MSPMLKAAEKYRYKAGLPQQETETGRKRGEYNRVYISAENAVFVKKRGVWVDFLRKSRHSEYKVVAFFLSLEIFDLA